MSGPRIEKATAETIGRLWAPWGIPIVSVGRTFRPEDVEGIALVGGGDGGVLALATWAAGGGEAEIVTLDAFPPGRGHGARVLEEAERLLASRGVRRIRLMTTNDNWRALGFYLRRGYRLARVHRDAMDEVYRLKPDRPRVGAAGIPLRDLWELEKGLSG